MPSSSPLSRLMDALAMILLAMQIQIRASRGSPATLIVGVVQPVVLITVTTRVQDGHSDAMRAWLVIGVGILALWGATVWAAGGVLRWEALGGTLAANVTGAWSPSLVLFGKCLGATVRSGGIVAVSVVVTAFVLDVRPPMRHPLLFLVGVVCVLASGVALGMLLSCVFFLTRHGDAVSGWLMYVIFILGGVLVPLEFLPSPVQWLSSVVSLRWAQQFLFGASTGDPSPMALAALISLTASYSVAALWLLAVIVDRARQRGTLELA